MTRMSNINSAFWLENGWQPVAIAFIPSETAWRKEMKRIVRNEPYPIGTGVNGHTVWFGNDTSGESVIYVSLNTRTERDPLELIMTLVHEAVHVFQFMCQAIGEKEPSIEFEAYSIQHIATQLINAYCLTIGKGKDWMKCGYGPG